MRLWLMVIVASEETQKKKIKIIDTRKQTRYKKRRKATPREPDWTTTTTTTTTATKEKKTKQNTINHTKRERGFDWWRRRWLSSASTRPIWWFVWTFRRYLSHVDKRGSWWNLFFCLPIFECSRVFNVSCDRWSSRDRLLPSCTGFFFCQSRLRGWNLDWPNSNGPDSINLTLLNEP